MNSPFLRQVRGFLVSGALAFVVDAAVYTLLLAPLGSFWAKQAAFVLATIASFFLNKTLAFRSRGVPPLRIAYFVAYYAAMAWVNPGINELFLTAFGHPVPAFVAATGVTAVLNFFFMRTVVFRGANT